MRILFTQASAQIHEAWVYTIDGQRIPISSLSDTGTVLVNEHISSGYLGFNNSIVAIDMRVESMGGYADAKITIVSDENLPMINVFKFQ